MKEYLGWLALDIDGTITLDPLSAPQPVVAFLREKVKEGWRIAMVTGRPMTLALRGLDQFDFPYLVLAQNGTFGMEMPSQTVLLKRYIPKSYLRDIEIAFDGIDGDFIVYNGYQNHDRIYWRPHRLDAEQKTYVAQILKNQQVPPIAVQSYEEIAESSVPLVKCYGTLEKMQHVSQRLNRDLFHATLIRDLYHQNYYMLLITDHAASKGQSLEAVIEKMGTRGTIIAAGDDENDASMLKVADIKIAMAHAPKNLQEIAHFIAPPTHECGIIQALQRAIQKNGK